MKKILLFSISFWIAINMIAQQDAETLRMIQRRDSIFNLYQQHTDTVSVNTWLNIMTSNKYLKSLSRMDSLIALRQDLNEPSSDSLLTGLQNENLLLKNQLEESYRLMDYLKDEQEKKVDTVLYGFIAAIAIILVLIILLIVFARKRKKSSDDLNKIKSLQTKLYFAEDELQHFKTAHHTREPENQKKYQEEISALREKNEKLNDEKLMLENQIIEVKKAWEMEVQKRMEVELTGEGSDRRSGRKLQRRINALEAENNSLLEKLEAHLKLLDEKENKIHEIQERLEQELEKTKQNPSQPVEDNTDSSRQKEYDQDELWEINKTLTASLAETKKNYESEIKTRLEIESELQELLEKLRNRYL